MKTFEPLHPKRVLAVAAHPDDLDFSVAASAAKWAAAGAEVYYCICTDGSKGSEDRSLTSEQLVATRETEQREAGHILGLKDVFFLGYPDGALEVNQDLKRDISRVIRQVKPDVVVTTDPTMIFSVEMGYINHPDHRAAGQATLDSVFPLSRDHLTFPELLAEGHEPHKTATVLLGSFGQGNYVEDVTATFDLKLKALAAHASQMADIAATQERMRGVAAAAGQGIGADYGETFTRIDIG